MDASVIIKGLGNAVSAAVGALILWLVGGPAGVLGTAAGHVLAIAGAACGLWFSLLYGRYRGVLAASAPGATVGERDGYHALREGLAEGGLITRLYANRLNRMLSWVERFFGDVDIADRSLFPHAFGLRTPAPLWTAPAFDRCLLLALFYPILVILLVWLISGEVGPAEAALGLSSDLTTWQRVLTFFLMGFVVLAVWRFNKSDGWASVFWLLAFTGALTGALTVAGAGAVAFAFIVAGAGAVAGAVALAGVLAVAGAVAFAFAFIVAGAVADAVAFAFIVAGAGALVGAVVGTVAGAVAFAVAGAFAVAVYYLQSTAAARNYLGPFLAIVCVVFTAVCLVSPYTLASVRTWDMAGPLLLFLGLLTLINAPFDWLSLGLTRALLRRGLELGGWWPLALAVIDAAAAALIVAVLLTAMVLGIQAFDSLAVLGGGAAVLPLDPLLAGIGNPETALEPEYWWVYALLLSTMIPSLVNLGIGGASLVRGLPGVRRKLLEFLPENGEVPRFDRTWIAVVLALQTVGGVIFGVLVQALIFWLVIGYIMPWFGLGLLDMAHDLVAMDLPGRLWSLLGLTR